VTASVALPEGFTLCPVCKQRGFKKEKNRQMCRECSDARSRQRGRDWARHNPEQKTVRRERQKVRQVKIAVAGLDRQQPAGITWPADGEPDLAWLVRVSVPFDWSFSKNAVWRNVGRGHVILGEEAKASRDRLIAAIERTMAGQMVVEHRVWLDIMVEKPSHRGDAINVLDTVADALKVAIRLDDVWFSVRRLDWRIVSDQPRLYVGFGQEVGAVDSQHCCHCGLLLAQGEEHFTRNRSTRTGWSRECRACRAATRTDR
jgi:hypothetical protein